MSGFQRRSFAWRLASTMFAPTSVPANVPAKTVERNTASWALGGTGSSHDWFSAQGRPRAVRRGFAVEQPYMSPVAHTRHKLRSSHARLSLLHYRRGRGP